MNNLSAHISRGVKYVFVVLLFPLLYSCKDNTGNLTPNILPKSDVISAYQTDTTTIITSMYLKDSAMTTASSPILLGSFNDPIFGESKASIYAEVGPSSSVSAFPTYPPWASSQYTVDSAVILLQLFGAANYGGNDPQTFVVYQLDTDIISTHNYYSDTNISYLHHLIPIASQQVNTSPSATNDTLRIKLNKWWWTNFVNNLIPGTAWANTAAFNQLIHGVYITTATPLQLPGQGSLLNVVPFAESFSGIFIYYHATASPGSETYAEFPIGGSANAYFVHFDHDYSTTYLGGLHPTGPRDSVNAGQLMYIQAMGGVNGRINLPNFHKNWSKLGHIIVNEATITFPIQPENITASYGPPTALELVATGANFLQTAYDMPDFSQPYYGGGFSGTSYTFVITQYIQDVINGKDTDRGLYLVANRENVTANGVVVYGAQHGTSNAEKPVLTIYYTPAKNP
jgi:hypothetical protein